MVGLQRLPGALQWHLLGPWREAEERPWATSGKSQLSTNAPYGELTVFIASLGDVGVKSRRFFFSLSAGVESNVLADARCDVDMEVRKH